MSPDAAELFAQVNATLLVALAVQGKPPEKPPTPAEPGDEDFPRQLWESLGTEIFAVGLIATLASLAMTLMSVRYNKALGEMSTSAVSLLTLFGMFTFFMSALGKAIGSHRRLRQRIQIFLLAAGTMAALSIWTFTFAPSFWP